ncbi:MAG: hypothetical protein ABEI74_01270 [Candidatus Pacearchaeota archaeon]
MDESLRFGRVEKRGETGFKVKDLGNLSRVDSISPPSVFIGSRLRYPHVNVGVLSPLERDEQAWKYDAEKYWAENNYDIKSVLNYRNSLLNSRFKAKATDARMNRKFLDIAKEVAIASNPVDMEVELNQRVRRDMTKDKVVNPIGLGASLKNIQLQSNVKVNRSVDKVLNDDIKASEGMSILYKKNLDEYALNKILSVGVMGSKKDRKLVPTRWSITATDDMIGKQILNRVRDYKEIEDFQLFFGEFMGNQYLVMMFPDVWSYELFELYLSNSNMQGSGEINASTDHEYFHGRSRYAFNTSGGYYAARLPILKYLDSIKRQASVVAIRIETPSYWAALGVWVVRESVKKAFENGKKFESKEELLNSAVQIGKAKFNFDCSSILKRSKVLNNVKKQKRLAEWF